MVAGESVEVVEFVYKKCLWVSAAAGHMEILAASLTVVELLPGPNQFLLLFSLKNCTIRPDDSISAK